MPEEREALHPGSKRARGVARAGNPVSHVEPALFEAPGFPEILRARFGIDVSPLAERLGVNESSLLRTLKIARRLVSLGWCRGLPWADENGQLATEWSADVRFSLQGAIKTAGRGELVGEYALKFVRKVLGEWDLCSWNDNPVRTQAHVLALLDSAVEAAGGRAPRRGGWQVA